MAFEEKKNYGKCPVCGKGMMMTATRGYRCNNEDCKFTIYSSYHGTYLKEKDVKDLIEKGVTDNLQFKTVEGNPFFAKLIIEDGKVNLHFNNKFLKGRCPICGGRIKETKTGYGCENRWAKTEKPCNFFVPKRLCNRDITAEEIEDFLAGKEQVLDGFTSNKGTSFSSILVLREEGGVAANSHICKCPMCGGDINVGGRAYNCSNFKHESIRCRFKIPRIVGRHKVTPKEVRQLCETGKTDPIEITLKDGSVVEKCLSLDIDGFVVQV